MANDCFLSGPSQLKLLDSHASMITNTTNTIPTEYVILTIAASVELCLYIIYVYKI